KWLRRSRILRWAQQEFARLMPQSASGDSARHKVITDRRAAGRGWGTAASLAAFAVLMLILTYGAWKLLGLLRGVSLREWGVTLAAAALTLGRVLLATALGTLWAVPAGLAIGLSPKLSRIFQPVVQVAASFPAPMLFPAVIAALKWMGVSLGWGSVVLMLIGTQWYILFNVIAGAMAVPADLREAATSFALPRWQRFRALYLPAIFP